MRSWFDMPEIPASPNFPDAVAAAATRVHEMIDGVCAAEGIAADRVFVGGISQGGALAVAAALSYRQRLAGAANFSGWLAAPIPDPLGAEAAKTPVLWCHGDEDTVVTFQAGQTGAAALVQHGLPVTFKAIQGLGHTVSLEELNALKEWMQRCLRASKTILSVAALAPRISPPMGRMECLFPAGPVWRALGERPEREVKQADE
eukprot:SM002202S07082  [mRNA]  locus=s2202:68:1373:+ [translate_table: standard]